MTDSETGGQLLQGVRIHDQELVDLLRTNKAMGDMAPCLHKEGKN